MMWSKESYPGTDPVNQILHVEGRGRCKKHSSNSSLSLLSCSRPGPYRKGVLGVAEEWVGRKEEGGGGLAKTPDKTVFLSGATENYQYL